MPTGTVPQPLADAAKTLQQDAAELERLIAEAVYAAETPSADRCVLPGPALEVQIEVGGRLLTASRESERSRDWRLLLPA